MQSVMTSAVQSNELTRIDFLRKWIESKLSHSSEHFKPWSDNCSICVMKCFSPHPNIFSCSQEALTLKERRSLWLIDLEQWVSRRLPTRTCCWRVNSRLPSNVMIEIIRLVVKTFILQSWILETFSCCLLDEGSNSTLKCRMAIQQ